MSGLFRSLIQKMVKVRVKTAVYFGVGRIRARGDMRANGRIPRPGNADLREVATQWRRLAEDAEAKERYN